MFNNTAPPPSFLYLPLYREFTRILIWPAEEDEEFSTYEVLSTSTNIPTLTNYRVSESEVLQLGVPYLKNHNYSAISVSPSEVIQNNDAVPVPSLPCPFPALPCPVPGDTHISPVVYFYSCKPNFSPFKVSVKVLSLKIQESLYPKLTPGTVDEVNMDRLISIPLTVNIIMST